MSGNPNSTNLIVSDFSAAVCRGPVVPVRPNSAGPNSIGPFAAEFTSAADLIVSDLCQSAKNYFCEEMQLWNVKEIRKRSHFGGSNIRSFLYGYCWGPKTSTSDSGPGRTRLALGDLVVP